MATGNVNKTVSATLDALNEATAWISTRYKTQSEVGFIIDASSDWDGTLAVEISIDGGNTAYVVETFTADEVNKICLDVPNALARIKCSAYTAGEALCTLYR